MFVIDHLFKDLKKEVKQGFEPVAKESESKHTNH